MGTSRVARREVLKSMVRVSAGAAVPFVFARWAHGEQRAYIVVTAYGGIWEESVRKNFIPCFERETGVSVRVDVGESAKWLNMIRANRANPPIHAVTLGELDALRAKREGLLEKVTVDKVPSLGDVPPVFRQEWDDYAVVQNFGAMGLLYNKRRISTPPRTWAEFIESTIRGDYGRNVSFPSIAYTWGPSMLWWVSKVYGGNTETAFTKLAAMRRNVVRFWTAPVDALNMFVTGEVDILPYWDGRSWDFIRKGNDWAGFIIPEEGTFAGSVLIAKVVNSPDITWRYVNCVLSPVPQAGHAATVLYAVVNKRVIYPDWLSPMIPKLEQVHVPPFAQLEELTPEWVRRWNREIGG